MMLVEIFTRRHFEPQGDRNYGYATVIGWFLNGIVLACLLSLLSILIWGVRMFYI